MGDEVGSWYPIGDGFRRCVTWQIEMGVVFHGRWVWELVSHGKWGLGADIPWEMGLGAVFHGR